MVKRKACACFTYKHTPIFDLSIWLGFCWGEVIRAFSGKGNKVRISGWGEVVLMAKPSKRRTADGYRKGDVMSFADGARTNTRLTRAK